MHVNAERLAAIVASSDDAIISKNLNSVIMSWNQGAERIFGYRADEMIGESILRIIPERLQHEELEIIRKLKQGDRIDHFDTVRIAKYGRELQVSLTISPIRDLSGKIIGASKVARDITQRKRDEAFQHLLVQELNHRVKNSLAIIQSIASQSLRRATSPQHFTESFNGRVQALAKAHDLLVRQRITGISLEDLVREQVHLGGSEDHRITMAGPEVVVGGRDAIHLGLVLHELATNARKYGALATEQPSGRLSIRWKVGFCPLPRLELSWEETGVEGIKAPEHKGFGSRLIERSLEGSGGEAGIFIGAEGLRCEIKLPLEREQDAQPDKSTVVSHSGAKRVLIVEDEPLIAMELEEVLTTSGFTIVGPVGTVSGALHLVATEALDVALLDANLGGRPVDEIAAALTRKNIPFVFATGHDRQGLPRSFAAAPIVRKPFNPAEVVATVAAILESGSLTLRAR
jgi:PAS domain S-box-containing protein